MVKNDPKDLKIIEKMPQSRVLVIGDIMLDRYVYGQVDRISPESPVPVLAVSRENRMLGGAGNTLSNLVNLKCDADIVCIVGDDEEGMDIQNMVAALDLTTEGILATDERPTIVKTRFLAGHQQLLRVDHEKIHPFSGETETHLLELAESMIAETQAVILSDYGKGLLTPPVIKAIIEKAKKHGIPVIVDPKAKDYSIYSGAKAVTPNKKELQEATGGMPVATDEDIVTACRALIAKSGIDTVVATRSKDGISVVDAKTATHIRSAAHIEVYDVSGAGDTVIATLAACLASGADIVKAASIANVAGSIVVTKVGTAPIRAEELIEFLTHHDTQSDVSFASRNQAESQWQAPILNWTQAKEEIQRWKARGLKVGFTNGCFDILHRGHAAYLNDARKRCDRLVVGLNKDSSVKILKGPERPIHDEESRANVLAALGCVDMVILFGAEKAGDDNTACALIAEIQPDIYFKGGDYTIAQIPEAPFVRAGGGEVEIMPAYDGHSTTGSLAKLKDDRAA